MADFMSSDNCNLLISVSESALQTRKPSVPYLLPMRRKAQYGRPRRPRRAIYPVSRDVVRKFYNHVVGEAGRMPELPIKRGYWYQSDYRQ
jgi:hypothetical protein